MAEAHSSNVRPHKFFVVEFHLEPSQPIFPVPANWLTNNNAYCYWPAFLMDKKIAIAAAKGTEPNSLTWDLCSVIVKYKAYSYESAVERCKKIENEVFSSLTGEETDSTKTRSRKRKTKKIIDDAPFKIHKKLIENPKSSPASSVSHGMSSPMFSFHAGSSKTTPSQTSSFTASTPQPTCVSCSKNSSMFEKLVTLLERQAVNISNLESKVDLLQSTVESSQNSNTQRLLGDINEPIPGLPCSTMEEIRRLNEELAMEENMKKMIIILGLFGGKDITSAVWAVLNKIFKKSAAEKITWTGANGKESLLQFPHVLNLIAMAVKQTFPKAQLATIYSIIKPWLRGARDREGCRLTRLKESILKQAARSKEEATVPSANEEINTPPSSDQNIDAESEAVNADSEPETVEEEDYRSDNYDFEGI